MNHRSRFLTPLLLSLVISSLACKSKESLVLPLAEQRKKAEAAKPSSGEAFILAAFEGHNAVVGLLIQHGSDVYEMPPGPSRYA